MLCRTASYDGNDMNKSLPAPNVPGNTDAERMSNALSMVLRVSKADLLKEEARLKRASEKKRAAKKPAS
jgi:hypothetical protein